MDSLPPQYVTDQAGNRVAVLLSVDEFDALLDDLQDLQDAIKSRDEPTVPWASVKAELGIA